MKKIHYGWAVCAVCAGVMFCTLGLTSTAFSVFLPYLIEEAGLTNTQGGMIPTIRPITSTLIVLFSEQIYNRIGKRYALALSCVMLSLSFVLFSRSSYPYYLVAALFAGVSYALGGMLTISLLIRAWFQSDRGLALGICSAGSGLASFLIPPIAAVMIRQYSLRMALMLPALIALVVAVCVVLIVKDSPEEKGILPYRTDKEEHVDKADKKKFDIGTNDRAVWNISIAAVFLMAVVGYGMLQNQALLYTSSGQPPMVVSLLISLCGITVMIIKPIYGRITDRLGAYRSNFVFFGLLIIGGFLSTLAGGRNVVVAVAAVICLGISLPIASVGPSLYANDIGGEEKHAKILKIYQIAIPLGQILIGPVPGILADMTGSYVVGYIFMTGTAVAALLLIQAAYKRLGILQEEKLSLQE